LPVCVVQQRYLGAVGNRWKNFLAKMQQDCHTLAMRLAGAERARQADRHHPYPVCYIRPQRRIGSNSSAIRQPSSLVHRRWHIRSRCHTARWRRRCYVAANRRRSSRLSCGPHCWGPDAPCRVRADGLNNSFARRRITVLSQGLAGVMRVTAKG